MKDNKLSAFGFQEFNRAFDFCFAAHTGGTNQRLAGSSQCTQHFVVGKVCRSNFITFHTVLFQNLKALEIPWRTQRCQTLGFAVVEHFDKFFIG
ncbi:hypothetical protein D3C78_1164870 [compost metagenome]